MYYEEKLIDGILMCQTELDGEWQQCSPLRMGARIAELEKEIEELKQDIESCLNNLTKYACL